MSSPGRPAPRVPTWAIVTLIVAGGVAASFLSVPNGDRQSRAVPDEPDAVASALAQLPPVFPTTTPDPYPVRDAPPASAPDDARTAAVDKELRAALTVDQYADIRAVAPTSWAAAIKSVQVKGDIILATLDPEFDVADLDAAAEDVALGISVVLPANFVEGISWIVVQDAGGTELARVEPMPADVEAPPSLGFLG